MQEARGQNFMPDRSGEARHEPQYEEIPCHTLVNSHCVALRPIATPKEEAPLPFLGPFRIDRGACFGLIPIFGLRLWEEEAMAPINRMFSADSSSCTAHDSQGVYGE